MNKALIEKLNSLSMLDLFKRYHVDWEEGRNFRCPFPNHGATGKTPSGRYYPETNSYGCFGCHKGGGPINFVMNMENISFSEATKKLMDWYKIEDLPNFSYQCLLDRAHKESNQYSNSIKFETISALLSEYDLTQENLTKIFLLFCQINFSGDDFTMYCIEEMNKSINDFILDVPEDIRTLISLNIDITKGLQHIIFENSRDFNALEAKSGFFKEPLKDLYEEEEGRYLFPLILPGNLIIGFSGRSLEPHIIKYQTNINFGFSKTDVMYGLDLAINSILEKGYVIVVEGILDVLRCRKAGYYNTISPCSTYLSINQIILLKAFTDKFLLVFDNDSGGDSATSISEKNLDKYRLYYERVLVPPDEDPDSYGLKDIDALSNLLTSPW